MCRIYVYSAGKCRGIYNKKPQFLSFTLYLVVYTIMQWAEDKIMQWNGNEYGVFSVLCLQVYKGMDEI